MIACVVIAGGHRHQLLDEVVLPSVAGFDEVLVVGEHHDGPRYRYLHVPAITATTKDALVKRDVGALAAKSDWLFYLADDHAVRATGRVPATPLTIGVPRRVCPGHRLNMGLDDTDPNSPYCAGHGGLFSRELIARRPWSTMPHHPLWDLLSSREYIAAGAHLMEMPDWVIEDVEPGATPWR